MNAYYNRHTGRMIPITGRCYKVTGTPEAFADFDLIAHTVPSGFGTWAVSHKDSGLILAQGATRVAAIAGAMRTLKSYGRSGIDFEIEHIRENLRTLSEPKGPGYA